MKKRVILYSILSIVFSGCVGISPELQKKISDNNLTIKDICKDNKELTYMSNGYERCYDFNIQDKHVEKSIQLKKEIENRDRFMENKMYNRYTGTDKDSYEKCRDAGYTLEQMQNVNYQCRKLEELKPYMSSNTYYGIKLGESIEKYNFLKKVKKDSDYINYTNYNLYDYDGIVYLNEDDPNIKIYVLTRFGLVDTIVVKLISKQGGKVVIDKLKSKYQLLKDIPYCESYEAFPKVNKHCIIFRNGEDNIAYIKDGEAFDMENGFYKGDIYFDTIIYSSNTYNVINQLIKEGKDTTKSRQNNREKSILNGL